ncbi:hypothetical protein [Salinimonas chungwhensis]|uniref:hypothetical protein n=1 Tax=Salinimonas chungwhensis TaxID=265425 RepID=UPI0003694F33|nr:hypothetical protein [Salinimonas chungwhensis]
MEMFNKKRTVVAITLSFLLSACGGGSDSDSSNDELNENESIVETDSGGEVIIEKSDGTIITDGVPNAFAKMSSLDGKYEALSDLAKACSENSSYYYETDNVIVFGNQNTVEDDYKTASAFIERQVDLVPQIFGMTWNDYTNNRRNIAKFAIDNFVENYGELSSVKDSLPGDFNELSTTEKQDLAWQDYISSNKEKRLELILEASDYAGYGWTEADVSHEDKIKVCLHEETDGVYVEAYYTGIALRAPSLSIPDDYNQLIRKGLVQMMQESLSHSVYGNPLPIWYSEGQARYAGGLQIADRSEHDQSIDVPMFVDAEDEYGFDEEYLELQYGMAFAYIENTIDLEERMSLFDLISEMAHDSSIYTKQSLPADYDFEPGETGGVENPAFVKAWDAQFIIDEEYNDLSYNRFKHNYHQLLSQ